MIDEKSLISAEINCMREMGIAHSPNTSCMERIIAASLSLSIFNDYRLNAGSIVDVGENPYTLTVLDLNDGEGSILAYDYTYAPSSRGISFLAIINKIRSISVYLLKKIFQL